jgi:hypothetical protein
VSLDDLPRVGILYPSGYRIDSRRNWHKSLLLFYDSLVALGTEAQIRTARRINSDTWEELQDRGLLHVVDPQLLINPRAIHNLRSALLHQSSADSPEIPTQHINQNPVSNFDYETSSNVSFLASMIFSELRTNGLADNIPPPRRPLTQAWMRILALLPQLLRPAGYGLKFDLQAISDQYGYLQGLLDLLDSLHPTNSTVVFDLEQVTADLRRVPLNEVLAFRAQHGSDYRSYARKLVEFMEELSVLSMAEFSSKWPDRRDELADDAADLRRIARRAWGLSHGRLSLGIVGTVWSQDIDDAHIEEVSSTHGILGAANVPCPTSCFSYVLSPQRTLRGPIGGGQ